MRKRIITPTQHQADSTDQEWLDLEALAEVEITSEDSAHPIEYALLPNQTSGWHAAEPGKQTIRIIFVTPQLLSRIQLSFVETQVERTQEYVLRWSSDGGQSFQEIVRQQWNFSPLGATSEAEDYQVELIGVTVLELVIIPEISGAPMIATLAQLRLG
jgi:hypothetical protein